MKTQLTLLTRILCVLGAYCAVWSVEAKDACNSRLISLKTLFGSSSDLHNPSGGNFVALTDDTVVFFKPSLYPKLGELSDGKVDSLKDSFVRLYPASRKIKTLPLTVTKIGDTLSFDGVIAGAISLDRLKLSREWRQVLKHTWKRGSSVTNLKNGRFLITGGVHDVGSNRPGESPTSDAIIFSSSSDSIVDKFSMHSPRYGHSAILLPDGNVFVIGGVDGLAEILDPAKKQGHILDSQPEIPCTATTLCLDQHGNPLVFGGVPARFQSSNRYPLTQIIRFDAHKGTFSTVGQLKRPRFFEHESSSLTPYNTIELCAEHLTDGNYLVCGGEYFQPCLYADFSSGYRENAELFSLPELSPDKQQCQLKEH